MNHEDTHPMGIAFQGVGKRTTSSEDAEVRAGRCQRMTNGAEQFMKHTKMTRKKRGDNTRVLMLTSCFFNFQRMRSVIIAKLRTYTCEYKLDLGSDGN